MTYNALLATREDGSPIELSYEQRAYHTYIPGITGTGKSTLQAQLALADMKHPDRPGLCVLDPHGTLVQEIAVRVPEHRLNDVILIDPADPDFPFAFNLFAPMPDQVELDRYASELVGVFEATFGDEWRQVADTMRNLTLTLLGRNSQENLPNTNVPAIPAMDEIPHLLNLERVPENQKNRPYWNQEREVYRALFYKGLQDAGLINVLEFWKGMYDNLTPRLKMGTVQRLVERMNRFLGNPLMARTLAQTENKLDFDEVLSDGRILLVNLSKSELGEENSRFLGSVLLARMTAAIFKRDPRRPQELRRFHVIIDEFHNLITSSFPKLFTDGRKFGVDVVVAHQKRGENLWAERTTAAAGNLICFELHGGDQQELAREFDLTPPPGEPEFRPAYVPFSTVNRGFTPEEQQRVDELEAEVSTLERLLGEPELLVRLESHRRALSLIPNVSSDGSVGASPRELRNIVSALRQTELPRSFREIAEEMGRPFATSDLEGGVFPAGWRDEDGEFPLPDIRIKLNEGEIRTNYGGRGLSKSLMPLLASYEALELIAKSKNGLKGDLQRSSDQLSDELAGRAGDQKHRACWARLRSARSELNDLYDLASEQVVPPNALWMQAEGIDTRGVTPGALFRVTREHVKKAYVRAPGRPRPYSDIHLEISNQLAHLGKHRAMFKLSNEEETNRVGTTLPLPEPSLSKKQLAAIRDRTRNRHCRPRAEVDRELLQRYQARLRAVGHTDWETGKPLPDLPRYTSDDADED